MDQRVSILKCLNCGLIQQNLIFSNEEISNFYKENYIGRNYSNKRNILFNVTNFLRYSYYCRFISLLENEKGNKKNLRILDYGSGDGFLSKILLQKGYKDITCSDFFLPEVSDRRVCFISPEQIYLYKGQFDVVFMINSIEHLSSFKKDFSLIVSSMNTNSCLIVETPNIASIDSILFGKYWGGLHQPRHTFLWERL